MEIRDLNIHFLIISRKYLSVCSFLRGFVRDDEDSLNCHINRRKLNDDQEIVLTVKPRTFRPAKRMFTEGNYD